MPKKHPVRPKILNPEEAGIDSKATVKFGTPGHPSLTLLADWVASGCSEESWKKIEEASQDEDAVLWLRRKNLCLKSVLAHKLLCFCLAYSVLPAEGERLPQGRSVRVQEALVAMGLVSPSELCDAYFLLKDRSLSFYLQLSRLGAAPSAGDFLSADLELIVPILRRLLDKPCNAGNDTDLETLCLPSSVRAQVEKLLEEPPDDARPFWLALVGAAGSGRRSLGWSIAARLGKVIISPGEEVEPASSTILGLGQNEEGHWDSDPRSQLEGTHWVFLCANSADDPLVAMADMVLDLGVPDPTAVGEFAAKQVQKAGLEIPAECSSSLVERFGLKPSSLKQAIQLAGRRVRFVGAKAEDHPRYLEQSLQAVSTIPALPPRRFGRSSPGVKALIEKSKPRLRREDLILAPNLLPSNQGIFLFHGPSGTGKSMAAEVMAGELGLDLWRIQASQLQDPYVGETEQRISALFKSLKGCHAVILLDEVDNFLSDRSRDASTAKLHNQSMVNTFLRELDVFDGILVFTTNLSGDLDPAVERRIPYRLCFPLPGEVERFRIWQNLWRDSIPQDGSVDLNELARRFSFPGGLIRNAFLAACQRGAEEGRMSQQVFLEACLEEDESRLKRETSRKIRGFAA